MTMDKFLSVLLQTNIPLSYTELVLQNALGCTIGSFAAIAASWFIFRSSFKLAEKGKLEEEKQRRKDKIAYYKYILEEACKKSESYNANIKDFINTVIDNPFHLPLLSFLPLNSLKRAFETGMQDEVLFAFTDRHRGKKDVVNDFSKICGRAENLYTRFTYLFTQIEKAKEVDSQRRQAVNNGIIQTKNLLQKIISSNHIEQPPYLDALKQAIQKYHQMKASKIPLQEFPAQFLMPLNVTVQSILNSNIYTDELVALENVTTRAIMDFNDIPSKNENFAKDIDRDFYTHSLAECELLRESITKYFSN